MAVLPENMSVAIDELETAVAAMESRLESARAERDEAKARQVELEIENANLRRELGLSKERQGASSEILRTIADLSADSDQLLYLIAETTARLFGAPSVRIALVDGESWGKTIDYGASAARVRDRVAAERPRFGGDNLPGAVIRENRQIHIPDLDNIDAAMAHWPVLAARAEGTRTVAATPLRRQSKPIGVLIVYRAGFAPFTAQELALQQGFADQAVIAIENARLFNETRESLERQTATADILRVIASSPSEVKPVFDAIASSAKRLLGGFTATVLHFIGDQLHLVAFTPTSPEADAGLQASFPRRVAEFPIFAQVRDGATLQFPDTEADNVPPMNRDLGRLRGFRSVLFVPLMNRGNAVGILSVTRTEPGAFAEHHVQLLQTFADQAVIAIANARLFNETQETLERQTATADILKVIASSPSDVQPVFDAIAQSANRLLGGFSTAVYRLVGDSVHLTAFTRTNPEADAALIAEFPVHLGKAAPPIARVMNGEPMIIADSEAADPQSARIARARGWRSVMFTPLLSKGGAIGFISVTRRETGEFDDHHVQLLRTFADQAVIAIENTRLFNETKEALERQTATAEILKVIASSPSDVQPVFDAVVHSANRLIGGFSTALFRYGDGKIHLAAFTPTDAEGDAVLQSSFPVPLDQFPPYRLTLEGAPAELPDTETEPAARDIARARGFRSMLFAPLMNDGMAVGIITVTRVMTGSFGEQHIRLLQMFADQAVIAIKNVGLFNEVKARTEELSESLQQQTAVGDVLKTISRSTFDLQPVLDTLVNTAALLCNADMAFIMRRDGEEYRAGAAVGYTESYIEFLTNHPLAVDRGTVTGRAVIERRPVQILDVVADPEYTLHETTSLAGQRTALGVPLLREDEPIGVIVLARQRVEAFTQKQIELVATFADQAVIAIANVRLFDELRQRTDDLSEALQQQTATADVLKVISRSAFDLKTVLDALLTSACRLCNADIGTIRYRDAGDFRLAATFGCPPEWIDQFSKYSTKPDRGTVFGRTIIDGHTIHIPDVLTDPDFKRLDAQKLMGFRAALGVPLTREGEVFGVINLFRFTVSSFEDKQIELVQTFADQAVIAIENVRLFDEVQARTRELSEALTYQTGSANILRVIASSPTDIDPVLRAIVESACELCDAYDAAVVLQDGEYLRISAHHGPIPIGIDKWPINRRWTAGRAFIDRAPVHIDDLRDDKHADFTDGRELSLRMGHRTILSVPLLREGNSIGAIVLRRTEVHPFSEKQIGLLQTFADQAVIAIGNVRLFEEVQQRTRELARSLDDLRTAQDRLVQTEKLASLGQLTAGIAHEIKNPLNFVNNFAALSAELTEELNEVLKPAGIGDKMRAEVNELTELLKGNLEKVVQHGKRADSIVKNMLLHSREGGGEHRPSDVNALVDESLNLAYHGARAEKPDFNVTLERDFDPATGEVDLFPQEITRVFLNLVSNGFHAVTKRRKEGGEPGFEPTLRASTRNLGDAVEIRIRDNGTGIPPEVREKMFDPFFTTKPAGEGTGLGLSMSHDIIVKQHGGTIDVDTSPGDFTEFRIVLPRTSNHSDKSRGSP